MKPSSRRGTREDTIDVEPRGAMISARSKRESPGNPAVTVTRDYEIAAASQSEIFACLADDNNAQNSNPCGELSAQIKRRNAYVRGKGSVTTRKKGIGLRSRIKTKKITKVRSQSRDDAEIREEPVLPAENTRDVENVGMEETEAKATYQETSRDHRQVRRNKSSFILTTQFAINLYNI